LIGDFNGAQLSNLTVMSLGSETIDVTLPDTTERLRFFVSAARPSGSKLATAACVTLSLA